MVHSLPGTMMMFFELVIISTVCSTLASVCVPVISMGLPPPVLEVPNPPKITLGSERFMAWGGATMHGLSYFNTYIDALK